MTRRRTAVVSGAGVGRAVTRDPARHDGNVGLVARGEIGFPGTIRDVERLGGRPIAFTADVADPAAVQEIAAWFRPSSTATSPITATGVEMTRMKAQANRPDNLYDPVGTDPGAHGRFDSRSSRPVAAVNPRWLKLGLAAVLGLAAGTMLFATEAQGREEARRRLRRD